MLLECFLEVKVTKETSMTEKLTIPFMNHKSIHSMNIVIMKKYSLTKFSYV